MLYFLKPLPPDDMDYTNYKPFIKNEWFRKNFMKFVYALQLILFFLSIGFGAWNFSNWYTKLIIGGVTFLGHELLHILVVYNIGDISLTYSGMFFWLNSNAIMSKKRFWLFMTLPLLVFTVIPIILLLWADGFLFELLVYIAWINAVIAGSDIFNSVLILLKPSQAKFCRGYYIVEDE